MQPTADADLERALKRLREKADELARLSISSRIQLLRSALKGYRDAAPDAVRALCAVKGLDPDSNEGGEEWLVGPMPVIRNIRLLIETLERLEAGQPVIDPSAIRTRPDGRVVVDAFPAGGAEKLMFSGFRGQVLMQPGTSERDVLERAASHYKTDPARRKGSISLVLGAGNVSSIPSMDLLYKMFVEGKACVLKMNPVNEAVGPSIERAFAACIDRGYLAVVYGGGDVGGRLVHHSEVDEIHMTGSDKTYDLLVWGPPSEQAERKAKNTPALDKPFSSELGNISPWLIVPGEYTRDELAALIDHLAGGIANNASFNCNSPKLIVLGKGWAQEQAFCDGLAAALRTAKPRRAYYPGAADRWNQLVSAHTNVVRCGEPGDGDLAWAIIRDVDPQKTDDLSFRMEPWCALVSQVSLATSDPIAFLRDAVAFVNERVWGTLSATIMIPRSVDKTEAGAEAVDRAVLDLRYGVVSINCWSAPIYTCGRLPWGGHPSVTSTDIQSGLGWVHNTYMLDGAQIEKTVLRSPLVVRPKLPYFIGHRSLRRMGEKLCDFEMSGSAWKLPAVVAAALAG
jgi:acyl-CoA reductase-like NAD-dependent aldehyde dehydrogenase